MTKPILEIAKELLELEGKGTPGYSLYLSFWESEFGLCEVKPIDIRNHLRTLCEALVEAHKIIDGMNVVKMSDSFGTLHKRVNDQAQQGDLWLKKWGGDE